MGRGCRAGGAERLACAVGTIGASRIGEVGEVDATGKRAFATQTLEVLPGLNNVTLTLLPDYSVEFVLREGDKLVPWALRALNGFKFERVDGEPLHGPKSTSFTSGRMTCYLTMAGVYRVTIPQLPGYRAVEPFEVTEDRRTRVEKVIQLVRE